MPASIKIEIGTKARRQSYNDVTRMQQERFGNGVRHYGKME